MFACWDCRLKYVIVGRKQGGRREGKNKEYRRWDRRGASNKKLQPLPNIQNAFVSVCVCVCVGVIKCIVCVGGLVFVKIWVCF